MNTFVYRDISVRKLSINLDRQNIIVNNLRIEPEINSCAVESVITEWIKPLSPGLNVDSGFWIDRPITCIQNSKGFQKGDVVFMSAGKGHRRVSHPYLFHAAPNANFPFSSYTLTKCKFYSCVGCIEMWKKIPIQVTEGKVIDIKLCKKV